jgi:hypothetical protein
MPVESAIGRHITEPRVSNDPGALQLRPGAAEFLFQKHRLLYASVMHHTATLPRQKLCSLTIARSCALA